MRWNPAYLLLPALLSCTRAETPPVVEEEPAAAKVELLGNRFWVDRKEFYVKGAACTRWHTRVAEAGGNTVRIYAGSLSSGDLLDELAEAGLMCYFGFSMPKYKDRPADFEDPAWRADRIAQAVATVEAFKDHPAILCWCLGNELEGGGYQDCETLWSFYGDLDRAVHAADPAHPTTLAITNAVNAAKVGHILAHCPSLDFLSVNAYGRTLSGMEDLLVSTCRWTKPFMITEYGPVGTWQRSSLEGRINAWGSLIQLSSEEAAEAYRTCWDTIRGFKHCLGSCIFWWGYQTHGEVLGWYPLFTREGYALPAVDAAASCWQGTAYTSTAPLVASWAHAITLDGADLAAGRDPVVAPGSSHTASVTAVSRSGKALRYKWFLYRDNTYDLSDGLTGATIVSPAEALPDGSMDEDAGAALFVDRTLPTVRFSAPATPGNYRLYVIVYDDAARKAGSACLNFKTLDYE